MIRKIITLLFVIGMALNASIKTSTGSTCTRVGTGPLECFKADCSANNNICNMDKTDKYKGNLVCSSSGKICLIKNTKSCDGNAKNCASGKCGASGQCKPN